MSPTRLQLDAPGSPEGVPDDDGFLERVDEAFGRARAERPSPMVRERPELLVVEEGLAAAHGDAVEDLLEVVIDAGGWVALAGDGALEAQEGIAVVETVA